MNGYRSCTETYRDDKSEPIPTMNGYRQLYPARAFCGYRQLYPFCVLNWLSPVVPRSWLTLLRTGTGPVPTMNGYRSCTETYHDNKSEPIPTMNGYRQLHPFCVFVPFVATSILPLPLRESRQSVCCVLISSSEILWTLLGLKVCCVSMRSATSMRPPVRTKN